MDIWKWSRSEGCTVGAMDLASRSGHLSIVKIVHSYRTEGCTTDAMDDAAGYGYLEVVKFLSQNRTEGCTKQAMDEAGRYVFGYCEISSRESH
ncbi:hypothetical protein THRCLA_01482 [Thraustotheca clavata]|uniref:Ankyrin repeat n=1 Tax=Thraustotheca clavata TaxID=74557 RepID=A0A1W0A8D1_9STRA|nr:hypothetical protein THRCLA_01482 [Thraustotheca clavata]